MRKRFSERRMTSAGKRKLSVFYEIWPSPLFTIGGAHLISQAIEVCGGTNVFAVAHAARADRQRRGGAGGEARGDHRRGRRRSASGLAGASGGAGQRSRPSRRTICWSSTATCCIAPARASSTASTQLCAALDARGVRTSPGRDEVRSARGGRGPAEGERRLRRDPHRSRQCITPARTSARCLRPAQATDARTTPTARRR